MTKNNLPLIIISTPAMMMLVNDKGESVLEPGKYKIAIGGSLPTARSEALGAAKPVESIFTLKK